MPGGSFPSFPPTKSATTKQDHQKSSSPSSHSPYSDSVLFLHTSVNSTKQPQDLRQRPVSVPPTIVPGVLAELDGTEGRTAAAAMNFFSEKNTAMSAALLGRQPTINEDEENGQEEEEPISMPDFGAAVTSIVSDFGVRVKSEAREEMTILEDNTLHQQQMARFAGKAMHDGSECREGTAAEGTVAVHPMHLKREEEDAAVAEQRQREEAEEAELGTDAAALRARQAARQRKREPVVVGWRTLERAMRTTAEDSDMSPLEQFLLGSTLLSRLCSLFEMAFADAQRHQRGKFNLPIKEYGVGADGVMSATFPSYPMLVPSSLSSSSMPNVLGSPGDHSSLQQFSSSFHCMVRLQLFVCPQQFRLVAKLDYTGPQCPAESDVRIFERFFAREVVRMNNELAVFTFVTLCRLCHPPIFASFAQIMMAQMEPQRRWPWHVVIGLVHIPIEDTPGTQVSGANSQHQKINQKIVKNSVIVTDLCKRFVFMVWLKPQGQNGANFHQTQQQQYGGGKRTTQQQTGGSSSGGERHITLCYEIYLDELTFHTQQQQQMSPEETQAIESVLKTQTELCRQQSVADPSKQHRRICCIWPCIRALLEGHHQQQQRQPNPQQQQASFLMGTQQIQGSGL